MTDTSGIHIDTNFPEAPEGWKWAISLHNDGLGIEWEYLDVWLYKPETEREEWIRKVCSTRRDYLSMESVGKQLIREKNNRDKMMEAIGGY